MENSNPSLIMAQNSLTSSQEAIHSDHKHVVIWYDPYIYSSTKVRYIKAIKIIYDVQLFTDWKEASDYLKESHQASCHVITSEHNGELLVKEISNMPNIISIYVFCDEGRAFRLWTEEYPKVVCAETKFTLLLEKMSQNIITPQSVTSSVTIEQPNSSQDYGNIVLSSQPSLEAKSMKASESLKISQKETNSLSSKDQEDKEGKKEEETEDVIIIAGIDEMIKFFVKENVVIWYDPNVDSLENKNKAELLEATCNIQTFTDWKDAIKYLEDTQASFCQMIISGVEVEELLLQEITSLKCISFIYIFCEKNIAIMSNPSWMDKYKNLVHTDNDFTGIVSKIKEKIEKWRKKHSSLKIDLPSFASIFDDMDRSDENYRRYYIQGFSKFENRKQAKKDFLTLASALYGDSHDLKEFEKDYLDYEMKSILNWYTKESFLYKLTNNCLRIASVDSIQYCRLSLRDLELAIKEKYKQQSHNFIGSLYRGTYMSNEEWMRLQQNVGKDIEMYGFLSTTKNKNVAVAFCQEDITRKVFITIIVPNAKAKDDQGFAEVKEYSDNPDEDEILFNIRSRFTVLEASTQKIEGYDVRHLVLLYGAQAMRIFTTFENPVVEIKLQKTKILACSVCQGKINLDDDDLILGINITNPSEYTCHSCLYDSKMLKCGPLLCIKPAVHGFSSSSSEGSVNLTIKGSVIQNQEKVEILYYGHKCQVCKTRKSHGWYTCHGCQACKISYCNKCFFTEKIKECDGMEGHMMIFEGHPFLFWSEKLLEKEVHRLKYQEQKSDSFDQAKIFINTHNYKKGAEFCERSLVRASEVEKKSTLYDGLGLAYESLGEYQKAIDYYSLSLEIKKAVFGDNHSDTAISYDNLGSAYQSLGEYPKAIDFYSLSLEIRKTVFGNNHPGTATSYKNLGSAYDSLGEYQKAINSHSQSLEIRKAVFGDNHPDTASSYNSLGLAYRSLGEHQKAIHYYSRDLEICKAVFGDKHPRTATSYNNLGTVYQSLGEYQNAIDYYSLSLDICKAIFGDNHPDTAGSYNNLGYAYESLGEYQKAIDYYSLCLNIHKAVFGNKHPNTASLYNNLGLAYKSLGEYPKAIYYHSLSLEIRKAVFGDNHPDTAGSYNNLGSAYDSLGECQKAIDYYSLSLKIRKVVFGENHPDTAISYNSLGLAYNSLGEYQKAIDYCSRDLEICKAVFGDKHPRIASSYNDLGLAYESLGEYQKTIDYYSLSLDIHKAVFGENHPNTATSYNNLGSAYENLGEYQKAINYHSQSLEIRKAVFGDNHPHTAGSYNNLGSAYKNLGEYQKAIDYFSRDLEICKAVFGDNHPDTATSYNNLGTAYVRLGEYRKAIDYYSLSLEIKKAVFGDNHPDTATLYNNLGLAHKNLGEYQKALEYFSLSLKIRKTVFGNNHPRTASLYNNLGSAYESLGEYQKAIDYYSQDLEICKTRFGDNHSDTATSYNNLGSAYKSLREYQKAIDYYSLSLEISKTVFGENHPSTDTSYNNIGSAYESLGEYRKTIDYYSRSLKIRKAVFGDNHPMTATLYNNLGVAHKNLGEYQKAIEYFSLSLKIRKAVFGDSHPNTAASKKNLESAYQRLRECQKH